MGQRVGREGQEACLIGRPLIPIHSESEICSYRLDICGRVVLFESEDVIN